MSYAPADTKDRIWRQFVAHAIAAIEMSASALLEPDRLSDLEERKGWFNRKRRRTPFVGKMIPSETAVTQAIFENLEDVRNEQTLLAAWPSGYPDIRSMEFAIEQPPPRRKAPHGRPPIGRFTKPNDLRIAAFQGSLDLRVEAKVVLDVTSMRNAYLGVDGLRRFDDRDEPYTIYPYGLMVAYVVDDSRRGWESRLVQELVERRSEDWRNLDFSGTDRLATRHGLPDGCVSPHTDVVHLVLEIASRPTLRANATL